MLDAISFAARAHHGGLRRALDSLPNDTGLFA